MVREESIQGGKQKVNRSEQKASLRQQRLLARKALEHAGRLPFKPETSAKWISIRRKWNGAILVQIDHDTIHHVTPEMMRWWFENMAGTTTWNGIDFSGPEIKSYHLWHHRDHVAVTPLTHGRDGRENKGFLPGCDSKIEERFNEIHFHVNTRMHTTRLDDREFTFEIKFCGLTFGHITHLYAPEGDGISFYAETEIGSRLPVLGWLLNWLVVPFVYNKKTGEHWVRHNIEETGRTEDILPVLFEMNSN